jgi:hypothetical protein
VEESASCEEMGLRNGLIKQGEGEQLPTTEARTPSPQAPAEEHRQTQSSDKRLYSKIAPSRGLTKNLSQGG